MLHPIRQAAWAIGTALKSVATVNPTFMTTADKAEALKELAALEGRLAELRMRVLATAGDVAESTAAKDAGAWLAHQTRGRLEDARAELRLAQALDRRYPVLATALREGDANTAQARVIAGALDRLPGETPDEVVELAEQTLVGHAADFGPLQLSRLGARILEVVAPEVADAAEASRLAAEEQAARRKTRLHVRRVGDGTTRISALIPDAAATRLAVCLEAFTNPSRNHDSDPDDTVAARRDAGDPVARLTYPRRLGEAFVALLEALDPARLPLHAGDATTILITIGLDQLREELGTAEIIGASHVPGTHVDDTLITAAEARRLACRAMLIPAVLGTKSQILDLGRASRLYKPWQRKALLHRDRHCRAEGCTVPGLWCEAHHWNPWHQGGSTDLKDGVLLCHHHHTRAHDPAYHAERLPHGDIRYHRRR